MTTFYDYYCNRIQPCIEALDLFLKTQSEPYTSQQMLRMLPFLQQELSCKSKQLWNREQFLLLLQQGQSEFCRMFRRELQSGLPQCYTPAQISYIYDLDLELVEQAAAQTGLQTCPRALLPLLFGAIELSQTQYQIVSP